MTNPIFSNLAINTSWQPASSGVTDLREIKSQASSNGSGVCHWGSLFLVGIKALTVLAKALVFWLIISYQLSAKTTNYACVVLRLAR